MRHPLAVISFTGILFDDLLGFITDRHPYQKKMGRDHIFFTSIIHFLPVL